MTTPSTERKAGPLLGTGAQTTWPFTFKVFAATDIAVTIADSLGVETALVYGVDYSVTLNANQETSPGGTVTYPISGAALPVGKRLVIIGNLPYDQPLDLPSGGNFSPLALENQLDRLAMQIQQLRENLGRALQVSVTTGANIGLPAPSANELIGWDSTAQNLQNFALSELATAVAYATMRYDTFTGDGAKTEFTLTADPVTLANLDVAVGGVTQTPGSDYSLVSGVLVFTSAPPNGAEILARYGEGLVNVGGDSSDIRFLPAGTGSEERTVQDKLRDVVSVKDFGAVGDGVADDTAAIQAAIDACLANGTALYVPAGRYRLTSQVNIPVFSNVFERGLIIQGEGWGSRFIVDHAGTGFYVTCTPSFGIYQVEFRDLYFTDGTTSPDKIIHNNGAINTLVRDCKFHNATVGTGCVVNDNAYGLTLHGCVFATIVGVGVFYAYTADMGTYSFVNSVEGCDFSTVTTGIFAQGCNGFLLSNTVFQECTNGFVVNPVPTQVTGFNITVDTCWFERNTTVDISFPSNSSHWCDAAIRNTQFAGFDPTYQAHIDLGEKSKVSIEGASAGNTVFVSGSAGASAILFKATNFVQVGTYNWTVIDAEGNIASNTLTTPGAAIDISGNVTGLTYKSLTGVYASPASGSAVTLTTLPTTTVGVWLVTAAVNVSNVAGTAVSLVTTQAGTSAATAIKTAAQISISTSGLDLQATQTTGVVFSIVWTITRLS